MLPSNAAISGSALEHEQRSRLGWALLASLLLHLLLCPALATFPPTAGGRGARPLAGMAATLRLPLAPAAATSAQEMAMDPSPPEVPAAAASAAAAPGEAAASSAPAERPPAAAEPALAAIGERRLLAEWPPYLASVLSLPPPAETWYLPRRELTLPPVLQDEPLLRPPPGSSTGRGARVRVRVLIAADGAVDRVEVLGSGVPVTVSDAAVAAFAGLRFRPGEIEGVAVRSEARFELDFDEPAAGSSHASDRFSLRPAAPRTSPAAPLPGSGR
ncbi:energy transducer TonB [Accumulibacter sp.]|uniref:energy transducer TonB n=1 Tax=Accumulibacter sp. TaxID=2053492 RepID=UPI0025E14E21|nr:energy transducer TonB [Accumulibacter sp.]MCM8611503.1 energy transducer TonB [Accumulibacter sp.]MCM8635137.1 energy transducer TonB [Accumulibacter sp.]